jgi:chaperonin GroES
MENDMQFVPIHDRVLVRQIEGQAKTEGGIVSVGEGARAEAGGPIPRSIKIGDRIRFGKWSGSEVRIEARLILKEFDFLGVIHDDNVASQAA